MVRLLHSQRVRFPQAVGGQMRPAAAAGHPAALPVHGAGYGGAASVFAPPLLRLVGGGRRRKREGPGGLSAGLPHTSDYFGMNIFSCGPMWYLLTMAVGWIILDILFNAFPERYIPCAVAVTAILGWGTCLVWELPFCLSQGMTVVPTSIWPHHEKAPLAGAARLPCCSRRRRSAWRCRRWGPSCPAPPTTCPWASGPWAPWHLRQRRHRPVDHHPLCPDGLPL